MSTDIMIGSTSASPSGQHHVEEEEEQPQNDDVDAATTTTTTTTDNPDATAPNEDTFDSTASGAPLIDSASMVAMLQADQQHQTTTGQRRRRGATQDEASIATTKIASSVGSVVGAPRNAFLKSMTIVVDDNNNNIGLDLTLKDVIPLRTKNKLAFVGKQSKPEIQVESIGGSFALSRIEPGDVLRSINQKRCISSMAGSSSVRRPGIGSGGCITTAAQAMEYMHKCLNEGGGERQGILCVTVGNKEGDDILVQATIVKPKPTMTYEEMGMVVWFWGFLCIKSIDKSSVFYHTALKPTDHLISINDIVCDGLKPEQVAEIITSLPQEITVTVLRRKQRLSGMFG